MPDTYQNVIDRLHNLNKQTRSSRDGHTIAQCPAHSDKTPSLSITREPDRTLLHCFAGCETSEILKQLGMTERDLFNEPRTEQPQPKVITRKYFYHAADGTPTHRILRYSDKTFAQQHTTDSGKTWTWGKGDQPIPIYRLHQITDGPIWIFEGEKDTDLAAEHGLNATTTPGGAGKWEPQWATQLAGHDLIIVPDNDTPGQQHAHNIAQHMHPAGARIRIVDLPNVPEKGDYTDWVNNGGTPQQLHQLATDTPDWTPDTPPPEPATGIRSEYINWPDFWEQTHHAEWLTEPIIPKGRLVALYAEGKAGKSLLALEIGAALATGNPCIDTPASDPKTVVYIDNEMTADDLTDRLTDLGYGPETDLTRFLYLQLSTMPPLDTAEGGEAIREIIQLDQPDLIIIDTVARNVAGEENSADTYRDLYRHSLQPIKAAGISCLRLDHAGKDPKKGQRGSSAKNDDVDVVWKMTTTETPDATTVKLTAERRRMGWVPTELTLIRTDTGTLRHAPDNYEIVTTETRNLIDQLDKLHIPTTDTIRTAKTKLATVGIKTRTKLLNDAIRYRRKRETAGKQKTDERETRPETKPETPYETRPETSRETTGNKEASMGNNTALIKGRVSRPETDPVDNSTHGAVEIAPGVWEMDFTEPTP